MRKPVGITTIRMRTACDPLVLWRWGGWVPAAVGSGLGLVIMFIAAILHETGRITIQEPVNLFYWLLLGIPFLLTFQRVEFDNDDLLVRVSFWILLPIRFDRIPYYAVKGIGTDYRVVHVFPRPQNAAVELFLYTRKRRAYLLSRHWSEAGYREAVNRIRKHVSFPVLRFE